MGTLSDRIRKLLKYGDLWLIFALFGTILVLILPVPPLLLDLLLTVSISLSLLTLLVILYLRTPAEFTGFPTLLLFITLYRLALNVASTPATSSRRLATWWCGAIMWWAWWCS